MSAFARRDRARGTPAHRHAFGEDRGHHHQLRTDVASLARQFRGQPGPSYRARLRRALPTHLATVSELLRGRLRRAAHRRCAGALDQAALARLLRRAAAQRRGLRLNALSVIASSRNAGPRAAIIAKPERPPGPSTRLSASIAPTTFSAHWRGGTRSQPDVSM